MSFPIEKSGPVPIMMSVLLSLGLLNHVLLIPLLFDASGRDAWLATLIAGALLPVWTLVLARITICMQGKPLLDWVEAKLGKPARWVVGSSIGLFLLSSAIIAATDTLTWVTTTYLPHTPIVATSVALLVLCGIAAFSGFPTIVTIGGVLLPIVVLLGMFVSFANMGNKDYAQILPLFEHGWKPVWDGIVIAGGGFAELFVFVMLASYSKSPFRFSHLFVTSVLLLGLTIGPTIAALAEFGPHEAANLRYPVFSEWRLVQIGRYIEHVDFFAIYQWLSGAFVRVALALCLLADMCRFSSVRRRGAFLALCSFAILLVNVFPTGDVVQYRFIMWYIPLLLPGAVAMSLFLFGLSFVSRKGGESGGSPINRS